VLHGAGAQGVEIRIYRKVSAGEGGEVPHRIEFGDFGEPGRFLAQKSFGECRGSRYVGSGKLYPGAAWDRFFVDQLHCSTSWRAWASRSISLFDRFSVTVTIRAFSRPL